MKKALTSIVSIGALLALMTACETTGTGSSVVAQRSLGRTVWVQGDHGDDTATTTSGQRADSRQSVGCEVQEREIVHTCSRQRRKIRSTSENKSNSMPTSRRSRDRRRAIQAWPSKVRRKWRDSLWNPRSTPRDPITLKFSGWEDRPMGVNALGNW